LGKIATVGASKIVVRTRDEHCDPHVHAFHEGEGWELRIFFSYVSSTVMPELPPLAGSPSARQVQACMDKVTDRLDACREAFWKAVQNVCLRNRYVVLRGGYVLEAHAATPGALKVTAAHYVAAANLIEFRAQGKIQTFAGMCP